MIKEIKIGICETCKHRFAETDGFECSKVGRLVVYEQRNVPKGRRGTIPWGSSIRVQCPLWECITLEWCPKHGSWDGSSLTKCSTCQAGELGGQHVY